jgi:deoxyribose-phosphate aldolase
VDATRDIEWYDPARPATSRRRTLSLGQVAARLEHRLYLSEPTSEAVHEGCALAIRHGLSSVITLPEVVPAASQYLAGTPVGVVTIPGWRNGEVEPLSSRALLAEGRRLAGEGATDLGMIANAEQLAAAAGREFADDVTALVEAMRPCGARVRVVLDTDGASPDASAAACELLGTTGIWLVQGGSWRGTARTGLSRIQLMRAALPDDVSLKWTFPVRSLDSMLICIAEGVDRFNGDPEALLKSAERHTALGPLIVPVRGLDY